MLWQWALADEERKREMHSAVSWKNVDVVCGRSLQDRLAFTKENC